MLHKIYRAYRNKITNKFFGVVTVPPVGKKKGSVLISFRTQPFAMAPWEHFTDPHTIYWESLEMVRLFTERGYEVDIIEWNNTSFIPQKSYRVCVDIQKNLERLAPLLPQSCTKVLHILSAYPSFQNKAEQNRLDALTQRRSITLSPHRTDTVSENPAYADVLAGFGNTTIHNSYRKFDKPIFPIHESVAAMFPFPEEKNFETARKHFLWMGGGGAVLKGVDLLLEAFAKTPEAHIHIVGPLRAEKEFMEAFASELALPNIHLYDRPKIDTKGNMTVAGAPFTDVANKCATLLYPSASEGTSGAVIQAMHAGLYPIVTPESGIAEEAPIGILEDPTVDTLRETVIRISNTSPKKLREQAHSAWVFARGYYTKEQFSKSYNAFLDTILP